MINRYARRPDKVQEMHDKKQRRVLVVEDEQDIAELVALHLRDTGFAVTIAALLANANNCAKPGSIFFIVFS